MKRLINYPHLLVCMAPIIYAISLTTSIFSISGINSIYPQYTDNLFSISFLSSYLNFSFLSLSPYLLIPIAIGHYFYPRNKIIHSLAILILMIIAQINQTIYGVDIILFAFYFACLLIDEHSIYSKKNIFLFGLVFVYFFSAIAKMQTPEWQSLNIVSFLMKTNITFLNLKTIPESLELFLKLISVSIMAIEIATPLIYLSNRFEKIGQISLAILHFFSFIFLRIPHLSLFLCMIHYNFYQHAQSEKNA